MASHGDLGTQYKPQNKEEDNYGTYLTICLTLKLENQNTQGMMWGLHDYALVMEGRS